MEQLIGFTIRLDGHHYTRHFFLHVVHENVRIAWYSFRYESQQVGPLRSFGPAAPT